jgi:hypothetical protein
MPESSLQSVPPLDIASWQREQLPRWRALPATPPVTDQVTALAYCFWPPERMADLFFSIEAAFRATWEQCGRLRSKLVASHRFPELDAFCEKEGVALDLAPELSGSLAAMSHDCIHNLHRRFETPYVLIIQNDGFPLQPGLETFVGPYDYIGAPWGTPTWYTGLLFPPPAYTVGNGGFSLRSKRICELAAHTARHGLRWVPESWFTTEDIFYCRVLPRGSRRCRRMLRYAPPDVAGRFSLEANEAFLPPDGRTFGFHGTHAFRRSMKYLSV